MNTLLFFSVNYMQNKKRTKPFPSQKNRKRKSFQTWTFWLVTIETSCEPAVMSSSSSALCASPILSVYHSPTPPISSDVKLLLCDCVIGFSLAFLLGD